MNIAPNIEISIAIDFAYRYFVNSRYQLGFQAKGSCHRFVNAFAQRGTKVNRGEKP